MNNPADQLSDTKVYVPWPHDVIFEAYCEFRDKVYGGIAEIPEIQAGLHCLDFLTRASDVEPSLMAMIDASRNEALMRIELMHIQDDLAKTEEQRRADWEKGVATLAAHLKAIVKRVEMFKSVDV